MPKPQLFDINQEKELAMRISAGDTQAFEIFFNAHYKGLYLVAIHYLKDESLAEDAVQEVFYKIWAHRAFIDPEMSLKHYLYTIAKNHVLNILRGKGKSAGRMMEYISHTYATDVPANDIITTERAESVYKAIALLPKKRRIIVKLKVYKGLDNRGIAHKLGLSINTVKFQYSLALKQLRKLF